MPTRSRTPRDVNQLAHHIANITVQSSSTDKIAHSKQERIKNPAAVALGKLGGAKGGKARASKLTSEQRSEIAKIAAQTRWEKEA